MLTHRRKQCYGCEKILSTKRALEKHLKCQSTEKAIKCSECDKTFTLKCTFKIHKKTHIKHLHKCTKCDKTFYKKSDLQRHLTKFGHDIS